MDAIFWWYKLQFWQWIQAGRVRPFRQVMAVLIWWLPCVIAPLFLVSAGGPWSLNALDFLLSLDVPLTLALAGATAVDALAVEARAGDEDWIWPREFISPKLRWISRQRWLFVARWPAGFAIAASLLASNTSLPPGSLAETLVMALLGFVGGSSFAWAMQKRADPSPLHLPKAARLQGVAAISWLAIRDARERFDLRRASLLAIPALLAAPLGAPAGEVVKMLALWLPFLFVLIVLREATQVHAALRRWLSRTLRSRLWLTYWVWRYIVLGVAALVTLGILWWKFGTAATASQR